MIMELNGLLWIGVYSHCRSSPASREWCLIGMYRGILKFLWVFHTKQELATGYMLFSALGMITVKHSTWACPQRQFWNFKLVWKAAAGLLTKVNYRKHNLPVLKDLHCLSAIWSHFNLHGPSWIQKNHFPIHHAVQKQHFSPQAFLHIHLPSAVWWAATRDIALVSSRPTTLSPFSSFAMYFWHQTKTLSILFF